MFIARLFYKLRNHLSINVCILYTLNIDNRKKKFDVSKTFTQQHLEDLKTSPRANNIPESLLGTNEIQPCLDQWDSIILGQMRFNHAWTTKNLLCICGSIFALVIWTIRYDQCEYVHNDTTCLQSTATQVVNVIEIRNHRKIF